MSGQDTKLQNLNRNSIKKTQVAAVQNDNASSNDTEDSGWRSRSRFSRFFYGFLVIAIVGGFLYHLSLQFTKYLNYPTIVVSEKTLEGAMFPDITVCPMTYFDNYRDRVFKLKTFRGGNISEVSFSSTIFQKNLRDIWWLVLHNTTNETKIQSSEEYDYIPPAKQSLLPTLAVTEYAARIEDTMTFCRYEAKYCDFKNFTTFYDSEYGPCFQISPIKPKLMIGGVQNGLVMSFTSTNKLLINVKNALTTLMVGYKLFLHPRGTWPNLREATSIINAKDLVTVQFDYTSMEKLSTPAKPCSSDRNVTLCHLQYPQGLVCRNYHTTEETKLLLGTQSALYKKCGCISYEWPIPMNLKNKTSCFFTPQQAYMHSGFNKTGDGRILNIIPLNASANEFELSSVMKIDDLRKSYKCYAQFKTKEQEIMKGFKISSQCYEETYDIKLIQSSTIYSTSRSTTPVVTNKIPLVAAEIQKIAKHLKEENRTSALLQQYNEAAIFGTYLRTGVNIYVFPKKTTSLIVKEHYLYDVLFFLADAGGVLGLWVGFSLFTIFEIFDWAINRKYTKKTDAQTRKN